MEPDPGSLTRPGDDDELDDGFGDDGGASPLDLLKKAATEKAQREDPPVWQVPNRPGFSVRYTVVGLDPTRMDEINRKATNRKTGRINQDKVHCLVLAHQCRELYVDGQLLTEDGRPLRFGSPTVREALGVTDSWEAVQVFYGGPKKDYGFAILRHETDLLLAAGMGDASEDTAATADGDDEEAEDPTEG
jgi:hypothetical protein